MQAPSLPAASPGQRSRAPARPGGYLGEPPNAFDQMCACQRDAKAERRDERTQTMGLYISLKEGVSTDFQRICIKHFAAYPQKFVRSKKAVRVTWCALHAPLSQNSPGTTSLLAAWCCSATPGCKQTRLQALVGLAFA